MATPVLAADNANTRVLDELKKFTDRVEDLMPTNPAPNMEVLKARNDHARKVMKEVMVRIGAINRNQKKLRIQKADLDAAKEYVYANGGLDLILIIKHKNSGSIVLNIP